MPPPPDEPASNPEPRASASGLASVFRNLTSGRLKSSTDPLPTLTSLEPVHSSTLETQSREPIKALPDESVLGGPPELTQLLKQLQSPSNTNARVSAAEEVGRILELYPLKNVSGIWSAGRVLVDKQNVASTRKAGFDLLIACVKHAKLTPLERRHFFDEITVISNPEDFTFQLAALEELAKRGKDVESFEGLLVPVLTRWLNQCFQLATLARATLRKEKSSKSTVMPAEETTLTQVFSFLRDIIKFNFRAFRELDIRELLEQVLAICRKTTAEADVDNSIKLIDTMITYAYIPDAVLESCIEVLCNIYGSIKGLVDPAWNAISNLLRSHVAQKTSDFLLTMISEAASNRGRNMNAICGAISILRRIETASPADRLPAVPLRRFIRALELALPARSTRLSTDILKALTQILDNVELMESTSEKTWSSMLEVVAQCSKSLEEGSASRRTSQQGNNQQSSVAPKENKEHGSIVDLPPLLLPIFSRLELLYENLDPFQRASIMWFFMEVADRLPDSGAELLVNYYKQENLCYPSNERWLVDSRRLVEVYLKQRDRPSSLRIDLVQTLGDAYETISYICPHDVVSEFATSVLDCIEVEKDVRILDPLVTFAVEVASDADEKLFSRIITLLRDRAVETSSSPSPSSAAAARSASSSPLRASTSPPTSQFQTGASTCRVAAEGLVKIFIGSLKLPSFKGLMTYTELLHVARSEVAEIDARIAVLKLLFRLRADSNYAIYIIPFTESENLAASLWRTLETTSDSNDPEETGTIRSTRSEEIRQDHRLSRIDRSISGSRPNSHASKPGHRPVSGMPRATKATPPLWMHPGPGVLPIDPPRESSPMLYSTDEIPDMATERPIGCVTIAMNLWLETVIPVLQQGADWEIYSYVLLHLGSQLTNHALFLGSKPQIRMLRNILCEQIRATSFYDPPQTTGLRRSDVATCLFQVLGMLVSYRKHFAKSEEDEIVRTFVLGVGSWDTTSPGCIHALSLCCYELPLSVTKSLNQILQKMSQIITQSHVTVHILEFLVGLARLPEVYVNFRDDEFRTVIGIGFRYLQYVREQREKGQSTHSMRGHQGLNKQLSPPKEIIPGETAGTNAKGADELPQYVYALAYHVVTFWFMALKLQERPKFVPWMTKSLVYTEPSGKEVVEEQSRVTIDMMQRVAYSDRDETWCDPEFAKPHDGNILTKSYIVGLSIITIETATASGLSQITKRQPSGTDYFMFRPQAAQPPQHQVPLWNETISEPDNPASRKSVLPSYISLILNSSAAVTPRSLQPIPLPDDDATKRAISMFDRNATVDGHKVGIIYIGEDQTQETDILANEVGSPDYTDFITKIGTLIRLKGAKFNTQGLDREFDTDGEYTICWRDRVSEIVFHVTTMMPTNLDHDPQCINKKRHTGNDFVNIVFNNSGLPFNFDTFPSEFNYVNIVITPESRAAFVSRLSPYHGGYGKYYKVQVMSKPGFPRISSASEIKIISGQSLPAYVRMLALNSSTLSHVWANRAGGEHISPWRNRLRQINQLRERNSGSVIGGASSPTSTSPTHPHSHHAHPHGQASGGLGQGGSTFSSSLSGAAGPRRTSIAAFLSEATASHRSSVSSSGLSATAEKDEGTGPVETLAESFDFSRWA